MVLGDIMKMKKSVSIIMTLSFIFIISGGVASFVIGLRNDREEISKRVVDVNAIFEIFSANTSIFESVRDELYTDTLTKLFYDTMYEEDSAVKEKISNYEQLVDELTKNAHNLDQLCKNVYYPDATVNSKCKNYKSIYEQVINYFVSDVNLYNQNIEQYNKYQEGLESLLRLKTYSTTKDYIDYNHDKVFDGKEE
jgi:hypothetical protein